MNRSFRDIFDPIESRSEGNPTRTGAIVLILGLLLVVLVVTNSVPFFDSEGGYGITADFAKVNDVNTRTPVRVHGVDVGEVTGVAPGPDPRRSSQVNLQITQGGLVIHSDARAAIRWRTVLGGNVYIELDPGSPQAPRLSGPIPVSQTSDQVELDDVLRLYDGQTGQAQRSMIAGLSQTFADPSGTQGTINALPDLTTVGKGLAPYQGTDQGDLAKLIATTAQTAQQLGASTADLQNLVSGADQTLQGINAGSPALGRALALSPGTLESTQVTSRRLDVTLARLDPLVTNLRPGAQLIASTSRSLRPALAIANTVLDNAQPLLHSARPAFANLKTVGQIGNPFVSSLAEPIGRLNTNILPWLGQTSSDTKLKNYESIGPFFSVLNKAASEYDSSGYRLHLSTLLGTASVLDVPSLSSGQQALARECRAAATSPAQTKNCGPVSSLLASWLLGGKS